MPSYKSKVKAVERQKIARRDKANWVAAILSCQKWTLEWQPLFKIPDFISVLSSYLSYVKGLSVQILNKYNFYSRRLFCLLTMFVYVVALADSFYINYLLFLENCYKTAKYPINTLKNTQILRAFPLQESHCGLMNNLTFPN